MDARYLKENVHEALTEAFSSMLISSPDDGIEYIGNFLLQYVERKALIVERNSAFEQANLLAVDASKKEEVAAFEEQSKKEAQQKYADKLKGFIEDLPILSSIKQEVMDNVSSFLSSYLSIPAVYIAIKKAAGETEALHYFSASSGQEVMIGKKLVKVVSEGEEEGGPVRQGVSFEAFKLPEVPEEEPPAEDSDEPPPSKPPPKPQPLVIDNVMRDKRCKFFGIPKLGSYVAVPLSLGSIEHDAGCQPGPLPAEAAPPAEGEEGGEPVAPVEPGPPPPKYVMNKLPSEMIIGLDSIGAYRRFSKKEIETIQQVGEAMIAAFEKLEAKLFAKHTDYLDSIADLAPKVAEMPAKLAESEASILGAIGAELGAIEPPPMETLKPMKETKEVASLWTEAVKSDPIQSAISLTDQHLLPVPSQTLNLMFLIACLVGNDPANLKDVCGDSNWESIKKAFSKIFGNELVKDSVLRTSFLEALAACEPGNPAHFPPSLPALPLVCTWIQKLFAESEALTAHLAAEEAAKIEREAAEAAAAAAAAEAAAAGTGGEEE